jgi:hypothetical protein
MDSKEYSWKWVTTDELLSHGPCELLFAMLSCGAAASYVTLYDGENTLGTPIVTIKTNAAISQQLHLTAPIYCRKGLYVDVYDTNVTGVLVQWRELGHKEGG